MNGLLSALFQSCYFAAISLTSVSLATLVTIGATPVMVALVEQARGRRPAGKSGVVTTAVLGGSLGLRPSLPTAGLLAALGIGPTALAYTLYFRGLRTASASTAALLSLIEPLAAAVLAVLVLGDRLSATGIVGAVLLLAAVVAAVRADSAASGQRSPAAALCSPTPK